MFNEVIQSQNSSVIVFSGGGDTSALEHPVSASASSAHWEPEVEWL